MMKAAGKTFSEEVRRCIDECTSCHQVCLTAAGHALRHGGAEAQAAHIRLMSDCIQICRTSADFMLRGSPYHHELCGLCAEICRECAEHCEGFDDPVMDECAEACRSCAESCEAMAA